MNPEANRLVADYISKQFYNILQIAGVYPRTDERNRFRIFTQHVLYLSILLFHLVVFTNSCIIVKDANMVLFSQNVHFCLLIQVAIIVLLILEWKNLKIYLLFSIIAEDFYDYKETAAIGEDLLRSNMKKETRQLILIPAGVGLAAAVILIVSTTIDFNVGSFDFNRIASKFDYNLPLPYTKYPYYVTDGYGFYLTALAQMVAALILTVIISTGGFLFINISQKIILQLKILNNSLDKIEIRIENLYSELFGGMDSSGVRSLRRDSRYDYCYNQCLRKNFEHHQIILKAFRLLEDLSSLSIGYAYLIGTIVIALSLISAGSVKEFPGTTMSSMILCAVEVGYMFLFSLIGQRFIDLSTEMRFKMYKTRWYMCNKESKSSIMIFQVMTLKPMIMTVANVVPVNMETFTTVINGAYSYYNLVSAFDTK